MTYRTLYIDPPWLCAAGGGRNKRGADKFYPLMSTQAIMELPVQRIVHPDGCHLWLWTVNNALHDALHVMESWGFVYISCVSWCKPGAPALGQYLRSTSELCLFGSTKNRLPYKVVNGKRQQGITHFIAERQGHSVKPEYMRKMIERISYPPYCELFARRTVPNWTTIGNELGITVEDFLSGELPIDCEPLSNEQECLETPLPIKGFGFQPSRL